MTATSFSKAVVAAIRSASLHRHQDAQAFSPGTDGASMERTGHVHVAAEGRIVLRVTVAEILPSMADRKLIPLREWYRLSAIPGHGTRGWLWAAETDEAWLVSRRCRKALVFKTREIRDWVNQCRSAGKRAFFNEYLDPLSIREGCSDSEGMSAYIGVPWSDIKNSGPTYREEPIDY